MILAFDRPSRLLLIVDRLGKREARWISKSQSETLKRTVVDEVEDVVGRGHWQDFWQATSRHPRRARSAR